MDTASEILIVATFASAVVSTVTGTLAYLRTRERRDHAGISFVALAYGGALWAVLFGLQLLAGPTQAGYVFLRAKWVLATPVVTSALLFGLYYTGRGDWVTPRRTVLLSVEPAVAAAVLVLDPSGVVFTRVVEQSVYGLRAYVGVPATGFVLHLGYGAVVGAAFIMLLAEAATRSSGPYRRQATTVALAASLPLASVVLFAVGPAWLPPFDTTPVVFGAACLVLLVAMYRYDLFDVAPVAHETVFAGLDDAIVVVDESDRVLETNPAAREAFDVDGDGVGLAAEELLPDTEEVAGLLEGDDAEVTLDDGGGQRRNFAASVSGPTYFEATCEPLGREGVRLLVFRDVTERTRVERRYRAYVEHADDIIAVADADGVLEYISPAVEGVLGHDPEGLEGGVFTNYIHPDDRRSVAEPFAESLDRPGESVRVSFRVEHADGGWRTLDGVGVNRFHDPNIGGYLMTLRDETRRERYEQRLRVLTRVLRHDLRNELNVVLGYADVIAATADDDTAEYAERIQRSAGRLASLGDRVRGVDRTLQSTDHGGRPVDVAAVADEVADRARDQFPEMTLTVDAEEAVAYADELLATAVWNVVENAGRHHDGDTPRVALTVSSDDETVEIRVADDGPGIPDGDRAAVESGHETQLQHASGIGLWLVRWIVDGVDGELTFVDDPGEEAAPFPDVATVVVVRLRATEGDDDPPVGDQIDPWSVPAGATEVADGGPTGWRPRDDTPVDAVVEEALTPDPSAETPTDESTDEAPADDD
ncbi:histidine kinase N-terminal 7TM domain-containing protein [Halobaculum marinum]|uniref:histidine kinase n=1 Tax=Halobaculum marinum TaxID=3031996 RepID=A0ABD5WYH2_9EURY|nr:histidine kinase N-terminal 7TM domain-containing protein [Halobaculum sp. DT55]